MIFVCLNTSLGSYWHTLESMYSDEMNHLEDKFVWYGMKSRKNWQNTSGSRQVFIYVQEQNMEKPVKDFCE